MTLSLGSISVAATSACNSDLDDCAKTHTCGNIAGEGGAPGSGGTGGTSGGKAGTAGRAGGKAGTGGTAGSKAGTGTTGSKAGTGGTSPSSASGDAGEAGEAGAPGHVGAPGEAGAPSAAGAPGETGAPGHAGAPAQTACETTGACSCTAESCDGWCHGATCTPFETIATGQPVFPASRGIAVVDSDVYWTSSSSADASADKYRVQRHVEGGSVETLLSGQALGLGPLLVGADRLFVLDSNTLDLRSVKLDGSDLRTDQSGVTSFRYRSGRIYWPQITEGRGWNVSINSQSVTDPSDVTQEFVTGVGAGRVEVSDVALIGATPVCGLNFTSNSAEQTYAIGMSGGGWVFPESGAGRLERLEYDGNGAYYWLERASSTSAANLVMQNEAASSPTAITSDLNVTDFTLFQPASGATLVYYSYLDPATESAGLRLYDPSSAETRDVLTGDQVGSLITDDTYLYFFESNGHRLVRTPLPHVVFNQGK